MGLWSTDHRLVELYWPRLLRIGITGAKDTCEVQLEHIHADGTLKALENDKCATQHMIMINKPCPSPTHLSVDGSSVAHGLLVQGL